MNWQILYYNYTILYLVETDTLCANRQRLIDRYSIITMFTTKKKKEFPIDDILKIEINRI